MMKIYLIILFSLLPQISNAAETQTYFRIDYGMSKFSSPKLDALNASPNGSTIGFSFGEKIGYIEYGIFFRQFSMKSDMKHDNLANQVNHKGKTIGVNLNVFLNSRLSLLVGYASNTYEQNISNEVSAAALASIRSTYGLEDNHHSFNLFYGANIDLFNGKKYDIYLSGYQFPMKDGKGTSSAQIGFRFYMDNVFKGLFSGR